MLGLAVAQRSVAKYMVHHTGRSPSQNWRTFLRNHLGSMVSVDFLTVPTLTFHALYVFIVLSHHRRHVLHFNLVESPSGCWTAQQLREAFAFASPPKYLLRDRDSIYGLEFQRRTEALGLEEVRMAPRSPWQSPYVERLIGSVRRECLDHVIVLNQAHLHRLLTTYFATITGVGPTWAWTKMPRNLARCRDLRRERSWRFLKWADSIIATNVWRPEITILGPGASGSWFTRRRKPLRLEAPERYFVNSCD